MYKRNLWTVNKYKNEFLKENDYGRKRFMWKTEKHTLRHAFVNMMYLLFDPKLHSLNMIRS